MRQAEVAIVGGGPAGTAAALTLARYTKRTVLLIETSHYAEHRVGETVSAALAPLLDYLGVSIGSFYAFVQAYSTAAAWGSDRLLTRDSLFSGRGNGAHIDRRAFDLGLADASAAAGVENLRDTHFRSVAWHEKKWHLQLAGATSGTLQAQFVIDATGRRAAFARRAGARLWHTDGLTAAAAYFRGRQSGSQDHDLIVEATEHGWWYATLLPDSRIVTAFLSNGRLLRERNLCQPDSFRQAVRQTLHIADFVEAASLESDPRFFAASTQGLYKPIGPGWVAAGDSALASDPLSSTGIGTALMSGIQAARIADEALIGGRELGEAYPTDLLRLRSDLAQQRNRLYHAEQRWPSSRFWAGLSNQLDLLPLLESKQIG